MQIVDLSELRFTGWNYYRDAGRNLLARRMIKQIRSENEALLNYAAQSYDLVPGVRRLVVANGAFLVFHRITESFVEVLHIRRSERIPAAKDME